ncbi:MAG: ATP-binding cassette domain-containing protein [Thiotrichales bacterium]|jgi:zinc transport system ATP-binding protein|nr:ATP-binding cassette domain-containing protein [Thiotrichales bacterium]MBT3613912.1 ATP-binding cassette domain-containing protein [Thiotrichales bacterium]MBT3752224.1 ATP-binding cassette domain-containing protein [Thiotrichales bacterium]MBT4151794.1 ATP-binding cassette domain-containing protein [Thiotrichales bacterium]MBT4573834.1 ATP-binding cassette domain-containing protein [Thiotrichales bacterium]
MNINEDPLLEAVGISLSFNNKILLSDVSLTLQQGEIVTIIGPNGAGKSTLLRLLLGLISPTSGQVKRRKKLRIGYLPQKFDIDPVLPLTVRRIMSLTANYSEKKVISALAESGVAYLIDAAVSNLSGGEFQRVMLARTLLCSPELLVLDEPVQGVDYLGESEMYKLISKIRDRHNCAILMVSHDLHVVMASTDRVICIDQHICCQGHPSTVSADPEYMRLFGQGDELALYQHNHDHRHDLSGTIQQCGDGKC